jgi:hypothetical protein
MARFVLDDVDYDQMGGGVFPAVEELQRQLPVTAKLRRQRQPDCRALPRPL